MSVRRQQSNSIPAGDSERGEAGRQSGAAVSDLVPREGVLTVYRCDALTEASASVFEGVGQRDHSACLGLFTPGEQA
jgi:hypothetical protein